MIIQIEISDEDLNALNIGSPEEAIDLIHELFILHVENVDGEKIRNEIEVKVRELVDNMSPDELRVYLNKILIGG